MLERIPQNAVIAHYAPHGNGFAVITPAGKVLAPSFFDLRNKYTFFISLNGAGGWVVLLPTATASQPALF